MKVAGSLAAPRAVGMMLRVGKIWYRLFFLARYLSVNRRVLGGVGRFESGGEAGLHDRPSSYVDDGGGGGEFPPLIGSCVVPLWYHTQTRPATLSTFHPSWTLACVLGDDTGFFTTRKS